MEKVFEEIFLPVARRVGSLFTGFLAAYGVQGELANQLTAALIGLVAMGVDLALSHRVRQKGKK